MPFVLNSTVVCFNDEPRHQGESNDCFVDGGWNPSLCSDPTTCASRCAGVTTSTLFVIAIGMCCCYCVQSPNDIACKHPQG